MYVYLRFRDILRLKKYIRDKILTKNYIDVVNNT